MQVIMTERFYHLASSFPLVIFPESVSIPQYRVISPPYSTDGFLSSAQILSPINNLQFKRSVTINSYLYYFKFWVPYISKTLHIFLFRTSILKYYLLLILSLWPEKLTQIYWSGSLELMKRHVQGILFFIFIVIALLTVTLDHFSVVVTMPETKSQCLCDRLGFRPADSDTKQMIRVRVAQWN